MLESTPLLVQNTCRFPQINTNQHPVNDCFPLNGTIPQRSAPEICHFLISHEQQPFARQPLAISDQPANRCPFAISPLPLATSPSPTRSSPFTNRIPMDIQFIKGAAGWKDLPEDEIPEVAFIGRSNVGKSSLLNMLAERRALARTSRTPGKTQQFNYYLVDESYYFVDLPGFGYAKTARSERERWGRLIGRYLTERKQLALVFHLVDSRFLPTSLDQDVMSLMRGQHKPYVMVLTKADKISRNQQINRIREIGKIFTTINLDIPVILTSSQKKTGRDEMMAWIERLIPVSRPT